MAADLQTTTPPPPSSLHTPQTPRFGFDDNCEPYSPRKSSRVSAQSSKAARTPPPQLPKPTKKPANSSPSSSPPTAPKKTPKTSPMTSGRRISGALSADTAASAALALGLPTPEPPRNMDPKSSTTAVRNSALFPTPNKTPKKRPSEAAPGISAIARNLFPNRESIEDLMPTPKKNGRKKNSGYTLGSFESREEDQPIQIFTDSHDRVPEVDMSSDNPFYGPGRVVPEPTKRASKRRKITVPGEEDITAEEAEHRADGLTYVFRGKKVFRKFDDGSQAEEEDEDDDLTMTVPPNLRRPLTRSSIKPRLLFPTAEHTNAKKKRSSVTEDEEEAITDIEEAHPIMSSDDHVATPHAPKFAPVTPPTTARATRSKKVDLDAGLTSDDDGPAPSPTHIDSGKGAKVSPYNSWPRTKRQIAANKKREGSSLERASKKIRG